MRSLTRSWMLIRVRAHRLSTRSSARSRCASTRSAAWRSHTFSRNGSVRLRAMALCGLGLTVPPRTQNEVRSSAQMRTVFDYLRTSRFPGFEEVWFEIMQNLEVKIPPALPPATSTAAPVYATGRPDTGGGSAGDAAVTPGVRVATGHGEA